MEDIRQIHETVYRLLLDFSDEGRLFTFSLRKTNRAGRLEQGYWFYGNENYLAISFWTGMDWKNKTPNISFTISKTGETFLDISTSDSDEKTDFINKTLRDSEWGIKYLDRTPKGYTKQYHQYDGNYIESLKNFISEDKYFIDNAIHNSYMRDKKLIYFINKYDFNQMIKKVETYRRPELDTYPIASKPHNISSFRIINFGPINDTGLIKIPNNTQWVFLTGENGTGKTSLLKALATALCYTKITNDQNTEIQLTLNENSSQVINYTRKRNNNISKKKPIITGFCGYGASRLKTSASNNSFSIEKALQKEGLTSSLFNVDTILIDIQDQLTFWERNKNLINITEKRKESIRELLVEILPNVYDIRFNKERSYEKTLYIEKDRNNKELPAVTFAELASGLKSLVAMIGDMMMRLFNQQRDISDPSELTGVVIIDEIDLHLHPKLQKYLVEQLTKTFHKVQFIASTHSPIPLLGAPDNSCFFKIERNAETGVEIIDLSEIKAQNLLPNAILTSDLFDMNNLFIRPDIEHDEIRTENSYSEIIINDTIRNKLKHIASILKSQKEQN